MLIVGLDLFVRSKQAALFERSERVIILRLYKEGRDADTYPTVSTAPKLNQLSVWLGRLNHR